MSKFLNINFRDVVSALISSVIVAVLGYLSEQTNIFDASSSEILNVAILAGVASLAKAFGTSEKGEFVGMIKIK